MNWKRKLCLAAVLIAVTLSALPVAVLAQNTCPPYAKIYFGADAPNDTTQALGSKANPAEDMGKAFDICQACLGSAKLFEYKSGTWYRIGTCAPEEVEQTGVPLAQPVLMLAIGVIALALILWGVRARQQQS